MRIQGITSKIAASHRAAKQQRALDKAVSRATTPALRDELLSLQGR